MNRNRESEVPKHGAVNVLPIQENQRLVAVVQNQTTAVLLYRTRFLGHTFALRGMA